MKNEIYEILSKVAEENNLQLADTTSERNGYPAHVSWSIIGFESKEQYFKVEEELQKELDYYREKNEECELGVRQQELHRQDGWQLWYRNSIYVTENDCYYDMVEIYGNKDGYVVWDKCDEEEFIQNESLISECDSIEGMKQEVERLERMWEVIDSLEDDEIAVCHTDSDYYMEVMKRYVMGYYYDTHHYVIALTIE